jgi:hypothetical protein
MKMFVMQMLIRSFFDVSYRDPFICFVLSCPPLPPKFLTSTYFLEFDIHEGFQKAFRPRFFKMFKGLFGALVSFTPHF